MPIFQAKLKGESGSGLNQRPTKPLPTRQEQLDSLKSNNFDVLIIGGGATGRYLHSIKSWSKIEIEIDSQIF